MEDPKSFTASQRELYEFVSRLNREKADTFTEADEWLDTNPTTGQRKYFQSGPKALERQVTFAAHKLLVEPPVFDAMDPEDRTLWARRVLRVVWVMTDTADLTATKNSWLRRWAWGKGPIPDFHDKGPPPRMGLRCTLFDANAATWDRLTRESLRVLGERAPQPEAEQPTGEATPPKPDDGSAGANMTGEARALGLLAKNPGWTDTQIAKAARVHRGSLYRMHQYLKARQAQKDAGKEHVHKRQTAEHGIPNPDD